MEVSMSKTRRGKYIDNRIYHKGKCKGDMRFNLREKGKLPCFSYLCEGNHFRFIEERYEERMVLANKTTIKLKIPHFFLRNQNIRRIFAERICRKVDGSQKAILKT